MCLKYKQNEYVKENEKAPERQFIWTGEQISRLKDHKIILEKKKKKNWCLQICTAAKECNKRKKEKLREDDVI